jgi:hypothetical protein
LPVKTPRGRRYGPKVCAGRATWNLNQRGCSPARSRVCRFSFCPLRHSLGLLHLFNKSSAISGSSVPPIRHGRLASAEKIGLRQKSGNQSSSKGSWPWGGMGGQRPADNRVSNQRCMAASSMAYSPLADFHTSAGARWRSDSRALCAWAVYCQRLFDHPCQLLLTSSRASANRSQLENFHCVAWSVISGTPGQSGGGTNNVRPQRLDFLLFHTGFS